MDAGGVFGFLGPIGLRRTRATALCAAVVGAALTVFAVVMLRWFARLWTAQGIYADEHGTGGEIPAGQLWQAAGCVCLVVVGVVVGVAGAMVVVGHVQARPRR